MVYLFDWTLQTALVYQDKALKADEEINSFEIILFNTKGSFRKVSQFTEPFIKDNIHHELYWSTVALFYELNYFIENVVNSASNLVWLVAELLMVSGSFIGTD